MTGRLRPTAAIAAEALLPVDPGVALALAQELLEKPLMSNHSHGLWGYSGQTAEGRGLTIQSTGIGGPSAAIVLAELSGLGTRRAVRLGSCDPIDPALGAGDVLIVTAAKGGDGVSAALGATELRPDPDLVEALASALGAGARRATVASADLDGDLAVDPPAADLAAVDLETAATLAVGRRLGVAVGAALVVAGDRFGIEAEEATSRALVALGAGAARALADPRRAQPVA